MRLMPVLLWLCCLSLEAAAAPEAATPLTNQRLGLVINDDEPNSVAIGELYRAAHRIPEKNIAHVRISGRPRKLGAADFKTLKANIDAQLGADVQAVLMVWTAPYAVECNSITSAYTNGFDGEQCDKPCGPGKPSLYFDAPDNPAASGRISMLLPTDSLALGRDLIARGTARSFQLPKATAYFLNTSDRARSTRAAYFPPSGRVAMKELTIKTMNADVLEGAQDVMVYQTGMIRVAKLETLRFLPGALADHLTSAGGDLLGDSQMSSLRWLQAGATASYGTVSEPCNYWQKFPNSRVLLKHYLSGATAIEAYWASVAWPAQGVFIGDPLAAPYAR
jgi:uncharacterized protein (TIGR03790 family)